MKEIISSALLLILVVIGFLYIVGFSLIYLKKAYSCYLELELPKKN